MTPPWYKREGGGWNPLLIFVLLRQSKINIHCLDSPELALQDNTIFVDNDAI